MVAFSNKRQQQKYVCQNSRLFFWAEKRKSVSPGDSKAEEGCIQLKVQQIKTLICEGGSVAVPGSNPPNVNYSIYCVTINNLLVRPFSLNKASIIYVRR